MCILQGISFHCKYTKANLFPYFSNVYTRTDQIERNTAILRKYIDAKAAPVIAYWIVEMDFKLKIKSPRVTRFGDYRPPHGNQNHQITVNQNLNPYAFLITLVHEIAHLKAHTEFGLRILPHGTEWKSSFKNLMGQIMSLDVFPPDILYALNAYMKNPTASSCSDLQLYKVLFMYNSETELYLLDFLPEGTLFYTHNRRAFIKGAKQRTRYRCKELKNSKMYLFPAACEVYIK